MRDFLAGGGPARAVVLGQIVNPEPGRGNASLPFIVG